MYLWMEQNILKYKILFDVNNAYVYRICQPKKKKCYREKSDLLHITHALHGKNVHI